MGSFLREHGEDICTIDISHVPDRGTPLYGTQDSDPIEIQRRMAAVHARLLFVLDQEDNVAGIVDLWDVASRADNIPWLG